MSKDYYEQRAKEIVEAQKNADAPKSDPPSPTVPSKSRALAKVIQLPIWPEPQRAAPNVVLRSSLFGVVQKGHRKDFKKELLAAWPGTEIRFTGEQLDQFDETVWLQTVHLAAMQAQHNGVARFRLSGFVRALGLSVSSPALKRLDAAFTRMIACEVSIKGEGFQYRDNMLGIHVDDETGVYTVRLNPALAKLFDDGLTRVEWQTRLELKSDLAKWMHSFVLTHKAAEAHPQRISLDKLKTLCGVSEVRELKFFRRDIKAAMAQLQEFGVVKSWRITDNDALEFVRKRTKLLPESSS
jgi:hypothetical protein